MFNSSIFTENMMLISCFTFFLMSLNPFVSSQKNPNYHPDVLLNITELITKYGYPVETHEVTTEDGYVLKLFRIPHGRKNKEMDKKPLLMVHGTGSQAEHYVITGMINASLAYYCADNGYDVWLGNLRGTKHSRKNVKYNINDPNFWKFCWHQMGLYDLPAMIDYILQKTGRKNLFYLGHSQGATIFYVLNSLKPEYQRKFAQATLLAPSGSQKHQNKIIRTCSSLNKYFEEIAEFTLWYEFPPSWFMGISNFLIKFLSRIFNQQSLERITFLLIGGESGEIDSQMIPMIIEHMTSVSVFQLLHFAQVSSSGHFRQWDYGSKKNLQIYGTLEPPDYPVEKIKTPVAMFYSTNDILCPAQDIVKMCALMPGCQKMFKMKNTKWTHLDFIFSKHMERDLGQPLLEYMNKFDG